MSEPENCREGTNGGLVLSRGTLASLYFLALAARGAFILAEPATRLVGDERVWTALAGELAGPGVSFSPLAYKGMFHPPLYIYFIAIIQSLARTLSAVAWAQAVLGSLLAPLVAVIGTRTRDPKVGVFAGVLAALYPELVWYTAHFWSETLFIVLMWGALERLSSPGQRPFALVAAGALWGLAGLTRETALFLVPVVALWLLWPKPRSWRKPLLFAGACLLVVLPWTARNYLQVGTLVPVATRGVFNLWLGNSTDWAKVYEEYGTVLGGELDRVRLAQSRASEAIAAQQPWWIVRKVVKELPAFWGVNDHVVVHVQRRAYRIGLPIRWAVVLTTILAYLAVLALAFPWFAIVARERFSSLLVLLLVAYLGMHMVVFGSPRFRQPFMPVFFLLAARSLSAGWSAAWSGRGRAERAVTVAIGITLAASVATSMRQAFSHHSLWSSTPARDTRPVETDPADALPAR